MRRDFSSPNFNQNANSVPVNQHFVTEGGNVPQAFHRNFYTRQQPNPALSWLIEKLQAAELSVEQQAIGNPELPIYEYQEEIIDTVKNHPVTIVVGETGSGKSTQTPQFLQHAGYKVSLTQPRRIATYSIAERISEELTQRLGKDEARDLVGYQTAEKSTVTPDTKITVLTDGIEAVRRFYDEPETEPTVHVLDEVHEWNTNLELAVALIKRKVQADPTARFVLTSATMDAYKLSNYFAEATGQPAPVIEVPGRTYEIDHVIEPESTVVEEIIRSARRNPEDDILVFVPGKREIQDTIDAVRARLPDHIAHKATILPLHAKLSEKEQARINQNYPGIKIVVSTNVAQTSLTVDGVNVVIDCGLERRIELDDEGVEGLKAAPISQADCDQRKGRTGRTAPGRYIFTRYNKDTDYIPYEFRPKFAQPEILRTDIVRSVLRAESVGLNLEEIDLFHPVKFSSIRRAKQSLQKLGALDETEEITSLGLRMNELSVKPSSARMIVESTRFSPRVQSYVAAIAASIEVGGLPYFAHDSGREWQSLVEETKSDHLAQLELFIAAQNMRDKQLASYDLDVRNIRRAQELHHKIVHRTHASIAPLIPPSSREKQHIQEAVLAGLVDLVYVHVGGGKYAQIGTDAELVDREISDRSVVGKQRPKHLVGTPYRVEFMHRGEPARRHIVEAVTVIEDIKVLGRIATGSLIETVPERLEFSAGKLIQVSQKMFRGEVSLGVEVTGPVTDTPETRALMREHVLNNPGPAQKYLRQVKRELEDLQHLTRKKLNLFTQEKFEAMLDEALNDGVYEESYIDMQLRNLTQERNITINSFVSQMRINSIRKKAPETIDVNGIQLGLKYARGIPRVTNFDVSMADQLPDQVSLKDGRTVVFLFNKGWWSISGLRKKLAEIEKKKLAEKSEQAVSVAS